MTASSDLGTSWRATGIIRRMFPLLVVLSVIVLIAGIRLEQAGALLQRYGVIAVMVPTMVGTGGNLGAVLSSRLSTRFHLGLTVTDPSDRGLWSNVIAVSLLGMTIFAGLAGAGYILDGLTGGQVGGQSLLIITVLSGAVIIIAAISFSFLATYLAFRYRIDPDDVTIPVVTNLVDVLGMITFLTVAAFVLG
jgi:mgtE-like transporter